MGLVAAIFALIAAFHLGDPAPTFYQPLALAGVFAVLDVADAIRSATKARKRERDGANR